MPETPTAVWRSWFPAIVRLPGKAPMTRAKVFATDAGLFVYAQQTEVQLIFRSPILLDKTPVPGTDYASVQAGHVIETEAGTVTVTKGGGCACGMRALKSFAPSWTRTERKWGAMSQ